MRVLFIILLLLCLTYSTSYYLSGGISLDLVYGQIVHSQNNVVFYPTHIKNRLNAISLKIHEIAHENKNITLVLEYNGTLSKTEFYSSDRMNIVFGKSNKVVIQFELNANENFKIYLVGDANITKMISYGYLKDPESILNEEEENISNIENETGNYQHSTNNTTITNTNETNTQEELEKKKNETENLYADEYKSDKHIINPLNIILFFVIIVLAYIITRYLGLFFNKKEEKAKPKPIVKPKKPTETENVSSDYIEDFFEE